MSRSRKKYPIHSMTILGSKPGMMKGWKKEYHKKMRRAPIEEKPDKRQYSNIWLSPSDGKTWNDEPKSYRK